MGQWSGAFGADEGPCGADGGACGAGEGACGTNAGVCGAGEGAGGGMVQGSDGWWGCGAGSGAGHRVGCVMVPHLSDKPCFLGPLALQAEHLSGFHSNTHIPVVVGAQMRYEVTGDPIYRSIAEYFMRIITSSHSYATGGTSVAEFWTDPMRQGDTLHTENQETCTTYNMLKIARTLFRRTRDIKYFDFYERALVKVFSS